MAKKSAKHKLFKRAYNKAAMIQPGQESPLSLEESLEIHKYLYPTSFPGQVACTRCGSPTIDTDRKKPARCAPGVRICGVCCWFLMKEEHHATLL